MFQPGGYLLSLNSKSAESKRPSGVEARHTFAMIPLSVLRLTSSQSAPAPSCHDDTARATCKSPVSIRLTPTAVGLESLVDDSVKAQSSETFKQDK